MSNSELILVKDETKRIEFDILKRLPLEFEVTAIYNSSNDPERQVLVEDDEEKTGEESNVKVASSKENTSFDDDDDDGFKTPTSFDHKIPETKQCPPAPRKPKANKRKLELDLSQLVEYSWFPDLHRKVKKARTQDN
ncbi:hypothetical protein V6N13_080916 [Hibiscus sabdariffa]|uniref:Uncharacterized protein n=2 Tax=Hibiscus sabdariffa TaxID=183260 RepID=A0ABR2NGL5_9ROSI